MITVDAVHCMPYIMPLRWCTCVGLKFQAVQYKLSTCSRLFHAYSQAEDARRRSRVSDLHVQRNVVAVLGLLHCPLVEDITTAHSEFQRALRCAAALNTPPPFSPGVVGSDQWCVESETAVQSTAGIQSSGAVGQGVADSTGLWSNQDSSAEWQPGQWSPSCRRELH
jgi:hypothetical protein